MSTKYDVIIVGAGSIGVPTAMAIAESGKKVLVIDEKASPGQGNNKKAIGGIRATHSDYGKIQICKRSLEIFSTWEEQHGDDIGWYQNGYSFPVYTEELEKKLKDLLKIQQEYGLDIDWVTPEKYLELVPGINTDGLRGATFSPGDGSASPMLALNAMYFKSIEYGAEYKFKEAVKDMKMTDGKITEVITDKGTYKTDWVVNAAGNNAKAVAAKVKINLPITPDSHEAAITEPVKRFFKPMIVDMRSTDDSANYYFYQSNEGQVVFCITPNPPFIGTDSDACSWFLPKVAKRMVDLYPRLANLKVRRTWRGQYPMTPDGFPIVGITKEIPNYVNANGMCGQGFMLGPGMGELISRLVNNNKNDDDDRILKSFDFYRSFSGMEAFK